MRQDDDDDDDDHYDDDNVHWVAFFRKEVCVGNSCCQKGITYQSVKHRV